MSHGLKFLRYKIGLRANRKADGTTKLCKIEVSECDEGTINLQPVSGHNLANMPGGAVVSADEYEAMRDGSDVDFARAAMAACGWQV